MKSGSRMGRLVALLLSAVMLISAFTLFIAADSPDNAVIFGRYVRAIEDSSSLSEKLEYLGEAKKAIDAYVAAGGTTEDAAVAENYTKYLALEEDAFELKKLCCDFIDNVDAAMTEADTYSSLKTYMNAAGELFEKIDKAYVGSYVNYYTDLKYEIEDKEATCLEYIEYAKAAKDADTFASAKQNYDMALNKEELIEYPDFPGLDEAKADLALANKFMASKLKTAQEFIRAVENISRAKSVPLGIEAAYEILKRDGVDTTAEGADYAFRTLENTKKSYDRSVKASNRELDDISSMIFDLIF